MADTNRKMHTKKKDFLKHNTKTFPQSEKAVFKDDYFEDLDFNLLSKEEKEKYSRNSSSARKTSDELTSRPGKNSKYITSNLKELSRRSEGNTNKSSNQNNSLRQKDKLFQKKDKTLQKPDKTFHERIVGKNDGRKIYHTDSSKITNKGTCPYIRECGGCNILNQSYEEELREKQKAVEKLLNQYCKTEPIIGMKNPENYRNKVHVVFDHDKKGNAVSGVYEEGTHRVIPVERCLIHNQKADEIIATIRGMLKSFKIKTYDEDTGYGLLRHVLIRTGYHSKEVMVVLVLSSPIMPSKNNFAKALRQKHPEITTIVINVNDKRTSMVLGEKEQVIYGKGYIEDSLCNKVFRISPKSFYQVNPEQTELLYNKAIEMAGLTGNDTVIDAYCGTGTIGIIASDFAKKVVGVELNKDAVRDATINAKYNHANNIEFYQNDAGLFLSQMAAAGVSADVVFMDPPRSGSSEQFLDALVLLKPKKVVYISCNPVTLERDLGYLSKKGYKAERAVPVDMFPWTGHVETVVLLSKLKSTKSIEVGIKFDEMD